MIRFIVLPLLSLCVIYGEAFVPVSLASYSQRTCSCFASPGKDDEARRLKQEAERIRAEVASFEEEKKNLEREEWRKEREIVSQKEQARMRYSAKVPILKGDGSEVVERVDFAPRMRKGTSRIEVCSASLPLGIILGESEDFPGAISVDEVGIESNGELAGIQNGDLLRACTACQVTMMDTPTWQILAGGIGMPKTKRFIYSCDNRPFEEVMDAVGSNRMDPEERPVILVVERK